MAIDQPIKKRGRPPGSKNAKSKMEQKMELVHQRLALLDSSSGSDRDDDIGPRAIIIDCDEDDTDDVMEVVPLKMLMPKEVENEQRTVPGIPQTCNTQNTSNGRTNTTEVPVKGQNKCARYSSSPCSSYEKNCLCSSQACSITRSYLPKKSSVQTFCGSAMERAQEIQTKLPAEHPSFVKHMLHSHVVSGFWLGLPAGFCNKYLPKHDTDIVLEDENGNNHKTTYLGGKQGLSAGWRGFAINHDIKVGDVVVFELVSTTKFKVHIIREKNISTTDRAPGLKSFYACKKRKISKEATDNATKPKEDPETTRVSSKMAHDDTQNLVHEAIDGIRFSDSEMSFDDMTSYSNFNIVVDGLVIDCKFPDHQRRTYYELCCAQKSFLHRHLLRQLSLTLVVGVIMETINIAEGIRACGAGTSSQEDFLIWKKTLQSFDLLGMNVAFLLKRVDDLLGLPEQPRDPSECGKYNELKLERSRAGEKVKALESMMLTVKDVLKKIDAEMEEMESSVRNHDIALRKIATAPW
ncbi:B3 domain-containing protein Os01g0234100 isoform X1 [Oryza glaberrima]|uniref:B3 domain-containing protein Os01g0234100 isoform X1 n=1 Tax=Oryza glaberrima TaxID=4538 RepID=UPI00224C2EEE|nr:B3 domain-containing protein Os01g0234100 isoform X1 [Oryza glaberrima]